MPPPPVGLRSWLSPRNLDFIPTRLEVNRPDASIDVSQTTAHGRDANEQLPITIGDEEQSSPRIKECTESTPPSVSTSLDTTMYSSGEISNYDGNKLSSAIPDMYIKLGCFTESNNTYVKENTSTSDEMIVVESDEGKSLVIMDKNSSDNISKMTNIDNGDCVFHDTANTSDLQFEPSNNDYKPLANDVFPGNDNISDRCRGSNTSHVKHHCYPRTKMEDRHSSSSDRSHNNISHCCSEVGGEESISSEVAEDTENNDNASDAICVTSITEACVAKKYRKHCYMKQHLCRLCLLLFPSIMLLRQHRKTHVSSVLQCQFCKKLFSSDGQLFRHLELQHRMTLVVPTVELVSRTLLFHNNPSSSLQETEHLEIPSKCDTIMELASLSKDNALDDNINVAYSTDIIESVNEAVSVCDTKEDSAENSKKEINVATWTERGSRETASVSANLSASFSHLCGSSVSEKRFGSMNADNIEEDHPLTAMSYGHYGLKVQPATHYKNNSLFESTLNMSSASDAQIVSSEQGKQLVRKRHTLERCSYTAEVEKVLQNIPCHNAIDTDLSLVTDDSKLVGESKENRTFSVQTNFSPKNKLYKSEEFPKKEFFESEEFLPRACTEVIRPLTSSNKSHDSAVVSTMFPQYDWGSYGQSRSNVDKCNLRRSTIEELQKLITPVGRKRHGRPLGSKNSARTKKSNKENKCDLKKASYTSHRDAQPTIYNGVSSRRSSGVSTILSDYGFSKNARASDLTWLLKSPVFGGIDESPDITSDIRGVRRASAADIGLTLAVVATNDDDQVKPSRLESRNFDASLDDTGYIDPVNNGEQNCSSSDDLITRKVGRRRNDTQRCWSHLPNGKYLCKYPGCKRVMASIPALRYHIEIHSTDVYKCRVCSRSFTHKTNLRTHSLVHKEKRFPCHECHRKFRTNFYLRRHIQEDHMEVDAYSCNICGVVFSKYRNYQAHQLRHTTDKRFTCSICKVPFIRNQHLKIHMVQHTVKANAKHMIRCNLCSSIVLFRSFMCLKKHYKCQHPGGQVQGKSQHIVLVSDIPYLSTNYDHVLTPHDDTEMIPDYLTFNKYNIKNTTKRGSHLDEDPQKLLADACLKLEEEVFETNSHIAPLKVINSEEPTFPSGVTTVDTFFKYDQLNVSGDLVSEFTKCDQINDVENLPPESYEEVSWELDTPIKEHHSSSQAEVVADLVYHGNPVVDGKEYNENLIVDGKDGLTFYHPVQTYNPSDDVTNDFTITALQDDPPVIVQ